MKQKTLQEQYNLIQEGKGNAEVFMKAAKKQFPSFVRNAATLNETVSSLKRNHIISENILGLGMVSTNKSTTPDWFKIFNENMETIKEEAKAVEKKPTKDVVDMETKGYDYKNQDELNNMNFEEFLRGYYTELKNPKNADKTEQELKDIVKKNLIKNSLYYVENAQFGIEGIGYTDQLPGLKASKSDQMVPVKLKENRVTAEDWETYVELERGDTSKDYVELERGDTYNSLLGKAKRYVALHGGVSPQDFMKEFNIDIKTAQSLINDLPNNNRIDENLPLGEKPKTLKVKKAKKETTDSRLSEIDKNGKIATLEIQIEALDEIINSKNDRISMVTEDDNLSELVDSKKMKEMQREIKLLEKRKLQMEKLYEKMCGNKYSPKEVVDEIKNEE
jgi:hypothetical protein